MGPTRSSAAPSTSPPCSGDEPRPNCYPRVIGCRHASLLTVYRRLTRLPQGDLLFARQFSLEAPSFATVRPRFVELRPTYAELTIRKRRRAHKHIKLCT